MKRPLTDDEARKRRDKIARWLFGVCAVVLLGGYVVADFAGVVPKEVSVRWRSGLHFDSPEDASRYKNFDPDLVLGIAIGDTRYWINHPKRIAIVTRPCFWVTDWTIPERVEHEGFTYTVAALHPAALLYAEGVTRVSLPSTLLYTNRAEEFVNPELQTLELRLPDGSTKTFPHAQGFTEATMRNLLGLPPAENNP